MLYECECATAVPGCAGRVKAGGKKEVLEIAKSHADDVLGLAPRDDATVEKVWTAIIEANGRPA